jgi:ABC-type antimicrobial peptide transport system permease subunit
MTFDTEFERSIGEARFQTPVVVSFGLLATVLAGIGIFGLVSYLVEQRTREFGIRLAIGATRQHIWLSVVREAVYPALVGLAVGSAAALALETVVKSTVFGWQSSGALAAGAVVVALLSVAVVAALIPAARATRVDPALTLRAE